MGDARRPAVAETACDRQVTTSFSTTSWIGGAMATVAPTEVTDRYLALYENSRFTTLRHRSNTLIAWTSAAFYGWWLLVIMLAAFVPSFFRGRLVGPVNVGLLFVFLSLTLVVVVSVVVVRLARTRLDPISELIQADVEGDLR
jgi:uncharacterized membrane protein (DUF485 family)